MWRGSQLCALHSVWWLIHVVQCCYVRRHLANWHRVNFTRGPTEFQKLHYGTSWKHFRNCKKQTVLIQRPNPKPGPGVNTMLSENGHVGVCGDFMKLYILFSGWDETEELARKEKPLKFVFLNKFLCLWSFCHFITLLANCSIGC